ncbi:MAG TPA: hypothetical protein VID96_03915, partial [Xanthobacteraceae bacterium]
MVDIFSVFRRSGPTRRWQGAPARFAINLQDLGGTIGRVRTEPMRLPGATRRAPAKPAPAPEPVARE